MNRKEFLKTCGFGCLAVAGVLPLLEGCTGVKQIQRPVTDQVIEIDEQEFQKEKPGAYRRLITVKTEKLSYPILVYRYGEAEFRAFLLQCPHQSAELSVHGDTISCPAHGSEFNSKGEVVQGPAETNLHEYNVNFENKKIKILLR